MKKNLGILIPVLVAIIAIAVLYIAFGRAVIMNIDIRMPGGDGRPAVAVGQQGQVELSGELITFDGVASSLPGAWPRFRGADLDNISKENVPLAKEWSAQGPEILWSLDLGEGYAGAAVLNGRVYIIDYDMEKKADAIRCLSLDNGAEIWRYSYPVKVKRNHGMSRTVPAVTDKYVVTMGPKCHVTCLDSVTGEHIWSIDLVKRFGAKIPLWYAGQCPLIDDDKVILAPGGDALMVAVDCATGDIIWQSENPDKWQMTHSSVVPMEFAGRTFYIYCASGGVAGVSVTDGQILFSTDVWKMRTNVPSPVVAGEGLIFLSAGYNQGSMLLKLIESNRITTEVVFRLEPEVFGADQQTPIFRDGFIYGVRPDEQLVCMDHSGKIIWTSGADSKFGLGPFLIAGDLIYLANDDGLLTLGEISPAGFVPLAQAKVLQGHESWAPMALVSGRLLLRDLTKMVCIDIAEH